MALRGPSPHRSYPGESLQKHLNSGNHSNEGGSGSFRVTKGPEPTSMGNGKSPTVIRDPDSTNTSPVTTNSKCGARVVNHLHRRTIERPSRSTGSLRSRPPTKNCFSTKQETSASRQNLERGGVSEQGLIGAGNRWLTGPRRPKPPNHRPSWFLPRRRIYLRGALSASSLESD